MTLSFFEFSALSVLPISMVIIVSICDKNKRRTIFFAFQQHHEINVIILTLQPKITQEEQSARPCVTHPSPLDSCQVTQSAMLSSWPGDGAVALAFPDSGMIEEALEVQISCNFQE